MNIAMDKTNDISYNVVLFQGTGSRLSDFSFKGTAADILFHKE